MKGCKNKKGLLASLSFEGSDIYYPLLSVLCFVFFYIFTYDIISLTRPAGRIIGSILVVLSSFFASVWGFEKKWISKDFVYAAMLLMTVTFTRVLYFTYGIPIVWTIFIYLSVFVFVVIAFNLIKKPILSQYKLLWAILSIAVIGLMCIKSLNWTVLIVILSLTAMAMLDVSKRNWSYSVRSAIFVIAFLEAAFFIFIPYNPFTFLNKNIVSINSFETSSAIVAENKEKYELFNGSNGLKLVDAKFELFDIISPYYVKFIGLRERGVSEFSKECKSVVYPIIVKDSSLYFSADIELYKFLEKERIIDYALSSMTSKIYFDYIEWFSSRNEKIAAALEKDYEVLQKAWLEVATAEFQFNHSINNVEANTLRIHRFLRAITIGMFNALSRDLIRSKDYKSALGIFSNQFYFTYFEEPIYKDMTVNFDVQVTRDSTSDIMHFSSFDLKRKDIFEPWLSAFNMACSYAEKYISIQQSKRIADFKENLSSIYRMIENETESPYSKEILIGIQRELTILGDELKDDAMAESINDYASCLQSYLFKCVENDYASDYNAFFLNRFLEVSKIIPMNPNSLESYTRFRSFYSNKFDSDTIQIRKAIEKIQYADSQISQGIQLLDSIETMSKLLINNQLSINSFKKWFKQSNIATDSSE